MEENNDIRQTLSDPERVSWLAALGWPEEDIAKSLGMSHRAFMDRVEDPADELFDSVARGRLQKRAEVEIKIARGAAAGDTDSIKQFSEIVRDRSFSISKLDLFGGTEKEGAFQRIQDYIASGSKGTLSEKEQMYLDILPLVPCGHTLLQRFIIYKTRADYKEYRRHIHAGRIFQNPIIFADV